MQALIIFLRAGRSRKLFCRFFVAFYRVLTTFHAFFVFFSIFSWILRDFRTFSEAIRTVFLFGASKLMHFALRRIIFISAAKPISAAAALRF